MSEVFTLNSAVRLFLRKSAQVGEFVRKNTPKPKKSKISTSNQKILGPKYLQQAEFENALFR